MFFLLLIKGLFWSPSILSHKYYSCAPLHIVISKCMCLVSHHLDHGNMEQYTLLELFKGCPATALRTAADKGQLNDWLMALAPMGEYPINYHLADWLKYVLHVALWEFVKSIVKILAFLCRLSIVLTHLCTVIFKKNCAMKYNNYGQHANIKIYLSIWNGYKTLNKLKLSSIKISKCIFSKLHFHPSGLSLFEDSWSQYVAKWFWFALPLSSDSQGFRCPRNYIIKWCM